MFRTVLFPLDQSRAALDTISTVLQLVQQHGSQLLLLSVVDSESSAMADAEAVAQLLQKVQDTFSQAGVSCEVIEREGKPAFVIGDVADETEADLIVMGTRGVNLEGAQTSTAARVIQLAPCPVLVVP
ncbi:MAG: universal stress protein [Synechococcus sp.]|nr:universal stress protein [Synechococcus sp.]